MNNRVYYHHPNNTQYSLSYVTQDKDEINTAGTDSIIEQVELEESFYVLYTNRGASGTVDDIDDEFETALEDMSANDQTFTLRFLQIFEGVIEEKEIEEAEKLGIYKQIELGHVPDAIDRVDWELAAVDVAGQIMSTLILKHALPNANHRTSISMAEWYLESAETGFSFPEFATEEYNWKEWVDTYIEQSKRILTVRRNTTAFSMLQTWGCDVVKRKGDIEIDLTEFDLRMPRSEALNYYAEQHAELCTNFMLESVKRAGYSELIGAEGPTEQEFIDYLERTK